MKLYHVSDRIDRQSEKQFIPRIPDTIAFNGEDRTHPRICFAPDVIKCLEAIGLDTNTQEYITVYELDTDSIDSKFIVTPNQLKADGLVYDACETQEYWVLCSVTLKPRYYQIISANWCLSTDGTHKELSELNIQEVDYSTLDNPFSGAIAAMFGC